MLFHSAVISSTDSIWRSNIFSGSLWQLETIFPVLLSLYTQAVPSVMIIRRAFLIISAELNSLPLMFSRHSVSDGEEKRLWWLKLW